MGSPLYMSPEQMESTKSAEAQSDIWALGIILYELLTKQVPFEGQAAMEVAIRVATHTPEPPSKHRPELPTGLDEVILKCMEKDRHKRYMNVAELAIALAEFGPRSARASVDRIRGIIHTSGLSVSDLSMPPSSHAPSIAVPVSVTGEPVGSTLPEPPPTKAPRRSAFVPAAVGVVLAVVVTAMALTVANLSRHAASTLSQQQAPAAEPPATPSPAPSSVPAAPEPASEASAAPVASPAVESRKPPVAAAASGPRRPAASTTALVRAPAAPPPSATAAPPPPRPTSPLTMQPM
jgi:eukaryotic-like serine/threonine-protein kinase